MLSKATKELTENDGIGNLQIRLPGRHATTPQNLELASAHSFRYVRITMKSGHDGSQFATLAEVAVH